MIDNAIRAHYGNLYWVGSRYSDCIYFDRLLAGSVCLYGKTHGKHIAICDEMEKRPDNNTIPESVNNRIREILYGIVREDPEARFFFYNPGWKYDIGGLEEISDRLIGVNDRAFYDTYSNKVKMRAELSGIVPLLDAAVLDRDECTVSTIESCLGESKFGYIVQSAKASGGIGTLILNDENRHDYFASLAQGRYIVSKYQRNNIPVNYHAVIYDSQVLVLPGSIQLFREENGHLIYKGADYVSYKMIEREKREQLIKEIKKVVMHLQKKGYRGVVGVDAMIYGDRIAVIEVNFRHQGSTAVLNIGLEHLGHKTVQQLALEACLGLSPSKEDLLINDELCIGASSYSYSNVYPRVHADYLLSRADKEKKVVRIDADGYEPYDEVELDVYKFRLCFGSNISSINPEGGIWIHQNVVEPSVRIYDGVVSGDPLALKVTLMTEGVYIDTATKAELAKKGGIREGNNNAVDIAIRGMIINAPCDVDYNHFAPYTIKIDPEGRAVLYYYDTLIDEVGLYPLDPLSSKRTKSGRYYADIAYLSTDRLRVHMTNKCIYKKLGKSCRFCNINTEDTGEIIPMEDIVEVVEDYIANAKELKHFLVGGQSAEEHSEKSRVVEIIKAIRERSDKNIYVMSLPFSLTTIDEMHDAGMTEFACNMEVYDDALAKSIMPGKGVIGREHYMKTLSYASKLYDKHSGVVRSALIFGLEPHASFIAGIKAMLASDVQPIISVFRPLPHTGLESLMMPPADYIYDTFIEAESLCRAAGLSLGPGCLNCQNNTLSLPDELAVRYVSANDSV